MVGGPSDTHPYSLCGGEPCERRGGAVACGAPFEAPASLRCAGAPQGEVEFAGLMLRCRAAASKHARVGGAGSGVPDRARHRALSRDQGARLE